MEYSAYALTPSKSSSSTLSSVGPKSAVNLSAEIIFHSPLSKEKKELANPPVYEVVSVPELAVQVAEPVLVVVPGAAEVGARLLAVVAAVQDHLRHELGFA